MQVLLCNSFMSMNEISIRKKNSGNDLAFYYYFSVESNYHDSTLKKTPNVCVYHIFSNLKRIGNLSLLRVQFSHVHYASNTTYQDGRNDIIMKKLMTIAYELCLCQGRNYHMKLAFQHIYNNHQEILAVSLPVSLNVKENKSG